MKKKALLLLLLTTFLLIFLKSINKEDIIYVDMDDEYQTTDLEKEESNEIENIKIEDVQIEEINNEDVRNRNVKKEITYVDIINKIRRDNGLSEIDTNPSLDESSSIRSKEISTHFSHKRLDGSGYYSVIKYGTSCSAENIAKGYVDINDVINGWMNSAPHRANILNNRYKYLSVTSYISNGIIYWDMLLTC